MTKIFNKSEVKEKRKSLRKNMPAAEIVLWSKLKNGQLKDLKFRRQYSVGRFVVDFYCPKHKLAIEVDGQSHGETEQQDKERQKFIESYGIKIIRVNNYDVYNNLDPVLEYILMEVGI
jgi:very-short-patch-repair endonuclease